MHLSNSTPTNVIAMNERIDRFVKIHPARCMARRLHVQPQMRASRACITFGNYASRGIARLIALSVCRSALKRSNINECCRSCFVIIRSLTSTVLYFPSSPGFGSSIAAKPSSHSLTFQLLVSRSLSLSLVVISLISVHCCL